MKKLFKIMNFRNDKKLVSWILFLTLLKTAVETVGISLMMPFIQISMNFDEIHENKYYEMVYSFLDINLEQNFVLLFGAFLLVFFLLRSFYTIFYTYTLSKFTKRFYLLVVEKLYHSYLGLSYRDFIDRNSSRMKQVVTQEAQNSEAFVSTLITTFSDLLTIIVVYIVLLYIDWKITIVFTLVLVINVVLLKRTITPRIKKKGAEKTELHRSMYKTLDETFGNFKMIKLRSSEESTEKVFGTLMQRLVRLAITNGVLIILPRLFLEFISFGLIISIIMYWIMEYNENVSRFLGILTVFFFAIYRLMPSINRVFQSYNNLNFLKKSLEIVSEHILERKEDFGDEKVSLTSEIVLNNLNFEYIQDKPILKDINLTIHKGENVAFVGPSGSGKSTIVDIIIGLYNPTSGSIEISGQTLDESNKRSWRKQVGYIPQDIFLLDATVSENVAMEPLDELDEERVIEVLKEAYLYDFLVEHQEGLATIVGDKGVKLSGGQKQRIAIARALYHDPEILVLDEATSALDTATEIEIMKNIYEAGADKTLLMIAHRLSTIENCDTIYTLEHGKIINIKNNIKNSSDR